MATLGDVIREVQLTASAVPPLLVRRWAQDALAQIMAGSRWGWQRQTVAIRPGAARVLAAVGVTQGSTSVTSAALFLAADVGKQLWLGVGEPVLTIDAFTRTSLVTVREAFTGTTGSVALAEVYEAYYQPPSSFQQFVQISDLIRRRSLPFDLSLERVTTWDPGRQQSGQPRGLIAHSPGLVMGSSPAQSRIRYEWWPRNTTGGTYEAIILSSPQTDSLTEATQLPGVLTDHQYVLTLPVLARCAAYPGASKTQPNPYFNLGLARDLQTQAAVARKDVAIVDEDQYPGGVIADVDWRYVQAGVTSDEAYQWSDASEGGRRGYGGGSGGWDYY